MATPTAQDIKVQLYAAWGDNLGAEEVVLNYTESTTTTGNRKAQIPKELAAGATNQSVDLSAYIDTATWIIVIERAGVGINWALANADTHHKLAANGVFMFKNANATPPTLYFDNPDGVNKTWVDIIVLGSST